MHVLVALKISSRHCQLEYVRDIYQNQHLAFAQVRTFFDIPLATRLLLEPTIALLDFVRANT